jgi:hypothetical protein
MSLSPFASLRFNEPAPRRRWKTNGPLRFGEFFRGWAIACFANAVKFTLVYELPQSQRCPGLNNFTPVNSCILQRRICRPCRFSHFTPVNSGAGTNLSLFSHLISLKADDRLNLNPPGVFAF